MITVYYWAPFLTQIATIKSVINSAISLTKYSKKYRVIIINVCGEWDDYKEKVNNVNFYDLSFFKYYKFLPKTGYFFSRLSLFVITIFSLIPLLIFLIKQKPNFFLIHLNSILPIFLSNFFYKTKFVLRISGYPKLHILRKNLWKISSKRLFGIISPTYETKNLLIRNKIFNKKKITVIRDPILVLDQIKKIKKDENYQLLAIGRLTRQKNFSFLIKCFYEINLIFSGKYSLIILGEGEERQKLQELILKLNLSEKVKLCGYDPNIRKYFSSSCCFILSSLWEDPGFVLLEASIYNTFIISSNCKSGPIEIVKDKKTGLTFKSNDIKDFISTFQTFDKLSDIEKNSIILNAKKQSQEFTIFRHGKDLDKFLIA